MKRILVITPDIGSSGSGPWVLECYRLAQRQSLDLVFLRYDKSMPFFGDILHIDVDGVIVFDDCAPPELLIYCLKKNMPVVAVAHDYFPLKIESVTTSFYDAMDKLKEHLLSQEVNKVGFAGNIDTTQSRHLYQSFEKAFTDIPKVVFESESTGVLAGLKLYLQFIKCREKPNAILFSEDNLAIGFIQAHKKHNPECSLPLLIGNGNSIIGSHPPYNLTSIDANYHGILEMAYQRLCNAIHDQNISFHARSVHAELVIRKSSDQTCPAISPAVNFAMDSVTKNKNWSFQDLGAESPMAFASKGLESINAFSTLFGPFFDWACVIKWKKMRRKRHVTIEDCYDISGKREDLINELISPIDGIITPLVKKLSGGETSITTVLPIVRKKRLNNVLVVRNNQPYRLGNAQQAIFDCFLESVLITLQQGTSATNKLDDRSTLHGLIDNSSQLDWKWNLSTNEVWWSEKALSLLDINKNNVAVFPKFFECIHPEDEHIVREQLKSHLEYEVPFSLQFRFLTSNNRTIWVKASGSTKLDPKSGHVYFTGILETINWKEDSSQSLYRIQSHTHKTGMISRMAFLELLVKGAHQSVKSNIAIFRIELCSYHNILSNLGFKRAAEYKDLAAKTLMVVTLQKGALTVIKDNELAYYYEYERQEELDTLIRDVRSLNDRTVEIANTELYLSNSMGCAVYPSDAHSLESAFGLAEKALNKAKEHQRLEFIRYNKHIQNTVEKSFFTLESKLRKAISEDQLSLYYQPQIDLATEEISGAEALLRWNSIEFGAVMPSEFIPVAEQSGLIHKLGFWAAEKAMKDKARWNFLYGNQFKISINVAPGQLGDEQLPDKLFTLTKNYGLTPEEINLEITESATIVDLNRTLPLLNKLRAGGFNLSLDDFGTGYSSLSKIKQIPLDWVKVDRMFIKDLEENDTDIDIVKAICDMCHTLGFETVCEGVETKHQLDMVKQIGVDVVQGFYFDKPMQAEDFEQKYLTTPFIEDNLKKPS